MVFGLASHALSLRHGHIATGFLREFLAGFQAPSACLVLSKLDAVLGQAAPHNGFSDLKVVGYLPHAHRLIELFQLFPRRVKFLEPAPWAHFSPRPNQPLADCFIADTKGDGHLSERLRLVDTLQFLVSCVDLAQLPVLQSMGTVTDSWVYLFCQINSKGLRGFL